MSKLKTDMLGQTIKLGDTVIYFQPYHEEFRASKILFLGKERVTLSANIYNKDKISYRYDDVIKCYTSCKLCKVRHRCITVLKNLNLGEM